MIGRTLAHFRIVDRLGTGAMGEVYLAEDTKLGREVALKLLNTELTDFQQLQRFEHEARTVARLNHPNIVTLHSIEEADGRRFLCMERVKGETLDRLVPSGGMSGERFLELALPLADAVAAAHRAGIVHRDLKPTNIMLGERLKVLDFGLAKLKAETEDTHAPPTRQGHIYGTLAYMAPELIDGGEATRRSDVFALGITFFEMLTGERPFRGPGLPKLLDEIQTKSAPRVSAVREDLGALDEIVARCLEKDPENRFESAEALHRALAAAAADISANVASNGARRSASARRVQFLAATIGLLVTLAASGLYLHRWNRDAGPEESAVQRPSTPTPTRVLVLPFQVQGNAELDYLSQGLVDLMSTKLDGAGELRSVDPRAALGLADLPRPTSPAAARGAALQLDAGLFLLGNLLAVGDRIQLTATLYEAGSGHTWQRQDPIAQGSVDGTDEQLFDLIDRLTAQLLGTRGEGPGNRITRIASVTTHSLPALKSYLNGEAAFRAGRFRPAFEAFDDAVTVDPGFALAWYRLGTTAEWLSNDDMSRRGAAEALQHAARLSDHDRRLLEGFSAGRRGAVKEAAGIYRELLTVYPDDVEAWFQLGEISFHFDPLYGVPITEAREPWRQVIRFEPDHAVALLHLARIAAADGRTKRLRELAGRFLYLSPEGERTLEMRALLAFSEGDPVTIDEVIKGLREAGDVTLYISAASVAVYLCDLDGAERLLNLMTEPSRFQEIRDSGRIHLAYLDLARGRWEAAMDRLEAIESSRFADGLELRAYFSALPTLGTASPEALEALREQLSAWPAETTPDLPQRVADGVHNGLHLPLKHYLLGLTELGLGRGDDALRRAETLEALEGSEELHRLGGDLAAGLRAAQAFGAEDPERALQILEGMGRELWIERRVATSPYFSRARERFLRGEVLRRLGRLEQALPWYASFEHQSIHGLIFLAPSHERRAEIYERLGRTTEAAAHYRRFIDLWAEADPALQPRVETAHGRLEALMESQEVGP